MIKINSSRSARCNSRVIFSVVGLIAPALFTFLAVSETPFVAHAQEQPIYIESDSPQIDSPNSVETPITPAVVTFPVKYSANRRYLVDQNEVPFPIMGRTAWFVTSLSVTEYRTFVDDTAARHYNAIELHVINHDPRGNHPPFNGNGDAPFLNRLDGTSWNGTLSGSAPDFTTPKEAYWSFVDGLLAYCESRGILVFFFPAYVGYLGGDQGWMQELVANGPSRIQSYGAWIANRYRNQRNLVWMMGGDMGTPPNVFNAAQTAVENALLNGLKSVAGQQSTLFSAEWDSGSIATDQVDFGDEMTLNGVYSHPGYVNPHARRAYSYTPIEPSFYLEGPYDQEGPDGTGWNSEATQPIRRFQWWGWLSSIGGYVLGNGYVWPFTSPAWQNHLDTQCTRDMTRLNDFMQSIAWYQLVPSGLSGMRNIITAGGSTEGSSSYVTAAANPNGSLAVAYIPPAHSGSITVDMGVMSGLSQARWFDPTNASYINIGTGLPNSGTRVFSPPGSNSAGENDWVLRIDSGTPASSPTASPSPTATATSTATSTATVAATATSTATVTATPTMTATATPSVTPAPTPTPPNGLVAAYNFNEGSGATVADASGNGLTGTIQGATWTTGGRYGNALSFNGADSYVDLGNPTLLRITGSFTLSAWIKAAANPPNDGQIIAKSDTASGWQLKTTPDTGPHTFGARITGAVNSPTRRYSTTVRSLNVWYHVAGVYDATAGTFDLYVNGVRDNGTLVGTIPSSQINSLVNVNIGRRTGGTYFNGIIDEVRIYNRALTQAQIQSDMNTPIPSQPINISGALSYCPNPVPAPEQNVTLTLSGSASSSTTSDSSGNYMFSALPGGGSYTVTPTKNPLAPGSAGINTVDVLAAQRHFTSCLTDPAKCLTGCRLIAAEVTGNNTVDTVDVIAIQQFFLGLSTGIGNVGQYKFIPANRSYSGVITNQTGQNYDALILGDVASYFVD